MSEVIKECSTCKHKKRVHYNEFDSAIICVGRKDTPIVKSKFSCSYWKLDEKDKDYNPIRFAECCVCCTHVERGIDNKMYCVARKNQQVKEYNVCKWFNR